MCIVCHDGGSIKNGLQGTVYVAGTMQTAVIKEIIGKVHIPDYMCVVHK